jgi:hypothetical protein
MRTSTLTKVLLAGAAGAYMLHRARKGAPARVRSRGTVPPPDPLDPVQELYSETDPSVELDTPSETTLDAVDTSLADTGDLYGVHMPPAEHTTHRDDDAAMADGQNWIESLQTDSIEGGAMPEYEVDISEDDELRVGHSSDTKDTPVADYGSGGRAGT